MHTFTRKAQDPAEDPLLFLAIEPGTKPMTLPAAVPGFERGLAEKVSDNAYGSFNEFHLYHLTLVYPAPNVRRILSMEQDTTDESEIPVASLASGDARIAIQTLKNAAYLAEKDNQKEIKLSHVRRAWNSARDLKKSYLFRKLTDHHRLLYELVVKSKKVLSGDLWQLYLKTCNARMIKPIAVRTYSDYCNKIVELGLVQAKRAAIQGKVREFSLAL